MEKQELLKESGQMNEQSEHLNELYGALAKAQGEFESAKQSAKGHYNNTYATLDECRKAVTPALSKHGLCFMQPRVKDETGQAGILCELGHSSGQFIKRFFPLYDDAAGRNSKMQETGKSTTYGRRYSMSAMLGIASEIDDDHGAPVEKGTKEYQARQEQEREIERKQNKNTRGGGKVFSLQDTLKFQTSKIAEQLNIQYEAAKVKLRDVIEQSQECTIQDFIKTQNEQDIKAKNKTVMDIADDIIKTEKKR